MERPLAGLRVLEIGSALAGPFGASLLADFGAEVIKVEMPGEGDLVRQALPLYQGKALRWEVEARNKKAITLDFHAEEDRETFKRLVEVSDAIVARWMEEHTQLEICSALEGADLVFSPIYSLRDIFEDSHYRARRTIIPLSDTALGDLGMQGVVPRLSRTPRTPGGVKRPAPGSVGQDNEEVLSRLTQGLMERSPVQSKAAPPLLSSLTVMARNSSPRGPPKFHLRPRAV